MKTSKKFSSQLKYKLIILIVCTLLLQACASVGGQSSSDKDRQATKAARINTELGVGYLRRGSFELALEKLQKAVAFDPQYADAHSSLAVLYTEIGDVELAERHHRKAVRADATNSDAQNNYGTFLCQMGRYEDSEERFINAAESPFYQTPDVALTNAGRCIALLPDYDRAEKHLRNALQFRGDNANALFAMAQIKTQQEDYLSARAFLQRYEATNEPTAEGLFLGYQIETRLADIKAAESYAQELQTLFPRAEQVRTLQSMQK